MGNTTLTSSEKRIWEQLSSSISDTPHDLILHTQRILFAVDNELPEQACTALQDLSAVLQSNGRDLRLRMFNLISPLIDETERNYFQASFVNDDQPQQATSRQYDGLVIKDEAK